MTYIGMKVQNVPFDGHLTLRWLGEEEFNKEHIEELKFKLAPFHNLRFTVLNSGVVYFGKDSTVPVVQVYGLVLDLIVEEIFNLLKFTPFRSKSEFDYSPHIKIPKSNYPLPNQFIIGPMYISNGTHPRIYLGA